MHFIIYVHCIYLLTKQSYLWIKCVLRGAEIVCCNSGACKQERLSHHVKPWMDVSANAASEPGATALLVTSV